MPLNMKILLLAAIIFAGFTITSAQEKILTEDEFENARSDAYRNALRVTGYSPKRTRKEGKKGIVGKPESDSHAVVIRESGGQYKPTRLTVELKENGKTRNTITVIHRISPGGFDKDRTVYYGYDAKSGLWYDVPEAFTPIEGFKYVSNPGERPLEEKIVSKSSTFKYNGTVVVKGKTLKSYSHLHSRNFTLDGKAGSYEGEIKYLFTDDGTYFKSDNGSVRKGPDGVASFASESEELEAVPGLTIDIPVSSGPAPASMMEREMSATEFSRVRSEDTSRRNKLDTPLRQTVEFRSAWAGSPELDVRRKAVTEGNGPRGPFRISTEHYANGKTNKSETIKVLATGADGKPFYKIYTGGEGKWREGTDPDTWAFAPLVNLRSMPKGSDIKTVYMFLGTEPLGGKTLKVYSIRRSVSYAVENQPQSYDILMKLWLSDGDDIYYKDEVTETWKRPSGDVSQVYIAETRADRTVRVVVP